MLTRWLISLALCLMPLLAVAQELKTDTAVVVAVDSVAIDSAAVDSVVSVVVAEAAVVAKKKVKIEQPRKQFVPNSKLALWFSLIPGGGQIYNRKYWKLPIVYGGFFGCIYALNWNNRMYNDYRRAYIDIMDNDPNTKSYMEMLPLNYDMTGKEERFKVIFKSKKDYYRKYRDMSIFIMVGVWALAAIDAYVDAELSTYDINKDLTLRVQPAIFGTDHAQTRTIGGRSLNGGVMLNLTF